MQSVPEYAVRRGRTDIPDGDQVSLGHSKQARLADHPPPGREVIRLAESRIPGIGAIRIYSAALTAFPMFRGHSTISPLTRFRPDCLLR